MFQLMTKRAAQGAAESRDWRFASMLDVFAVGNVGCWSFETETERFFANAQLADVYGKAFPASLPEADLGRWLSFVPDAGDDADALALVKAWRAALAGSSSFDQTHLLRRHGAEPLWVRSVVSFERRQGGGVHRAFGLCFDVDAEKRRSEVVAAGTQMRSARLATLSHEVRTPLNGVLGMAQLLERTDLTEEQRRHVTTIKSSGTMMLSILNDAVDLGKLENEPFTVSADPFDLAALVRETLESARGQAADKGLQMSTVVAPECEGLYCGDALRVRQIAANLVFNAVKFTESGSVTVALCPVSDPGRVRLTVVDTGAGVPEDERRDVFERFRQGRVEAARGGGRGAGLGLAICAELAELMGGAIGVDSVVGTGSTFWVELPLPNVEATAGQVVDAADEIAKARPNVVEDDGRIRILVAEDDPTNQKIFAAMLEKTGYELVMAKDGVEALERLADQRFNLVLMDINMPRMSGDEAIVQIRASDADWRTVPIIVVTALIDRDARRRYYELGADDYLPKPIEIDVLIKKINHHLQARAELPAAAHATDSAA